MEYWIRPICSNVLSIQTRTFKDPGSQAGSRACDRSICRHFLQSKCTFGDLCQFSHEVPELTSAPPGQTLKNQGPQHQGFKLWNDPTSVSDYLSDMEKPHQWYESTKNRGKWLARDCSGRSWNSSHESLASCRFDTSRWQACGDGQVVNGRFRMISVGFGVG